MAATGASPWVEGHGALGGSLADPRGAAPLLGPRALLWRRALDSVYLAFLVFALGLVLLELGLILFAPIGFMHPERNRSTRRAGWAELIHRPSSVPGLAYELAPGLDREINGIGVRTNSLGMRDGEPLAADTPGLIRIAVLGDSFTFGDKVNGDECFPAVLEELLDLELRAGGRRCDVLNFGTAGYSTRDEVEVLRSKALAFEPDFVLVGYCLNDPETGPVQPLHRYFAPTRWWQQSEVLRRIVRRQQFENIQRLGGGKYFRYLHALEGEPWQSVVDSFAEMRELTASANIPVGVVIFPMLTAQTRWAEYAYGDVHEQVAREANANGFEALDLLPAFSEREPATLVIGADDSHPSTLGHRIAAKEIARFVRPWLERPVR